LRRFGLQDAAWPAALPSFEVLTSFERPRGVQTVIGDLPVDTPLAIIEAETGSGKTEAALWHFTRLRSAGLVDALYFAVPTRAAASQLFERIREAMVRIGGPEAILAVPGQLRAGEAEGVRLPGYEVRCVNGGAIPGHRGGVKAGH
jgi:CRISPR-associated endonuclease/helicase Cas3